jgi:hypothetical protein
MVPGRDFLKQNRTVTLPPTWTCGLAHSTTRQVRAQIAHAAPVFAVRRPGAVNSPLLKGTGADAEQRRGALRVVENGNVCVHVLLRCDYMRGSSAARIDGRISARISPRARERCASPFIADFMLALSGSFTHESAKAKKPLFYLVPPAGLEPARP